MNSRVRERDGTTTPARSPQLLTTTRFLAILATPSSVKRRMDKPNEYRALLAEAEKLLADSTNNAINDRIELRDAVCAYFEFERTKGTSLSAIVDAVEAILVRAAGRLGQINGHKQSAQQLVEWCVELDSQGNLGTV